MNGALKQSEKENSIKKKAASAMATSDADASSSGKINGGPTVEDAATSDDGATGSLSEKDFAEAAVNKKRKAPQDVVAAVEGSEDVNVVIAEDSVSASKKTKRSRFGVSKNTASSVLQDNPTAKPTVNNASVKGEPLTDYRKALLVRAVKLKPDDFALQCALRNGWLSYRSMLEDFIPTNSSGNNNGVGEWYGGHVAKHMIRLDEKSGKFLVSLSRRRRVHSEHDTIEQARESALDLMKQNGITPLNQRRKVFDPTTKSNFIEVSVPVLPAGLMQLLYGEKAADFTTIAVEEDAEVHLDKYIFRMHVRAGDELPFVSSFAEISSTGQHPDSKRHRLAKLLKIINPRRGEDFRDFREIKNRSRSSNRCMPSPLIDNSSINIDAVNGVVSLSNQAIAEASSYSSSPSPPCHSQCVTKEEIKKMLDQQFERIKILLFPEKK